METEVVLKDSKTQQYLKTCEFDVFDTHAFYSVRNKPSCDIEKTQRLTPEELNSHFEKLGVWGIVIPVSANQNSYTPEVVKKYPRFIASYIHFNPNENRAEELGYLLEDNACYVGFKTIPPLSFVPVNDLKRYEPFLEVAVEKNMPVMFHCSASGNDYDDVQKFETLLKSYSELGIILAHWGGLNLKKMRAANDFAEEHKNIYLNTTALNPHLRRWRRYKNSNKKITPSPISEILG
jgi:predicted TIM-barrel fold metal-dependent hydrolase